MIEPNRAAAEVELGVRVLVGVQPVSGGQRVVGCRLRPVIRAGRSATTPFLPSSSGVRRASVDQWRRHPRPSLSSAAPAAARTGRDAEQKR